MSVGVRLKLVELRPPPVDAPVGSTDMSSMDLLKVYENPKSSPCSNLLRAVKTFQVTAIAGKVPGFLERTSKSNA